MSYLLDALRKADRERHKDRVPDLAQLHEPDADGRNAGLPGWVAPVVAALALLNVGVLSAFWLLREPEGTTPKNEAVSQTLPGGRPDRPAGSSAARTAASIANPPDDIGGRPPSIELSGHLYSSIPGRSFVLVNGRRYREGERLRQGPAVESIDEAGAVLNYRGERFRVAAPR